MATHLATRMVTDQQGIRVIGEPGRSSRRDCDWVDYVGEDDSNSNRITELVIACSLSKLTASVSSSLMYAGSREDREFLPHMYQSSRWIFSNQ